MRGQTIIMRKDAWPHEWRNRSSGRRLQATVGGAGERCGRGLSSRCQLSNTRTPAICSSLVSKLSSLCSVNLAASRRQRSQPRNKKKKKKGGSLHEDVEILITPCCRRRRACSCPHFQVTLLRILAESYNAMAQSGTSTGTHQDTAISLVESYVPVQLFYIQIRSPPQQRNKPLGFLFTRLKS